MLAACGGAAFQSHDDVDVTIADRRVLVRDDSGAIIVDKRQVGKVDDKGKITNSRKQLLAFVYEDSIRIKGGTTLPIKTDPDGALYIPEGAQRQAGLQPTRSRVRPDGRVSSMKGAKGIAGKGLGNARARRILLAVLLLDANGMWGAE